MICLGIDTSQKRAAVALTREGKTMASRASEGSKTHSETLLVIINDALGEAGISIQDVGLIAVGLGPGAWTGLRMGVTTAKSLAYALSIPIVGIGSLEAIAAGSAHEKGRLAVVIDARRGEVYGAIFEADGAGNVTGRGTIFTVSPERIESFIPGDCTLVGGGTELVPEQILHDRRVLPREYGDVDASVVCRLGVARFGRQGGDEPAIIAPIYVRKSDVEMNLVKKEKSI
jgi:tRNA threonylcarbamoyladenosine biosynthesis protein TsaB